MGDSDHGRSLNCETDNAENHADRCDRHAGESTPVRVLETVWLISELIPDLVQRRRVREETKECDDPNGKSERRDAVTDFHVAHNAPFV